MGILRWLYFVFKNVAVNGVDPSTNKGSKLHTIKISNEHIYKEYKDISITILNPSIDRLQFGFYPNQLLFDKYKISAGDWAEHQEYLLKSSFAAAPIASVHLGANFTRNLQNQTKQDAFSKHAISPLAPRCSSRYSNRQPQTQIEVPAAEIPLLSSAFDLSRPW